MVLYDELAPLYFDLEYPNRDFAAEIAALLDLFGPTGATGSSTAHIHTSRDPGDDFASLASSNAIHGERPSLLDLGCGSGEHARALDKRGFHVSGVDLSPAMVRTAGQRYPDMEFACSPLSGFRIPRLFDGAYSLFGVFNHILTDSEILSSLRNIRNHLRLEGRVLLDVWSLDPLVRLPDKDRGVVDDRIIRGVRVIRERGHRIVQRTPACLTQVEYLFRIGAKVYSDTTTVRVFARDELLRWMDAAGFRVTAVRGDIRRVSGGAGHGVRGGSSVPFEEDILPTGRIVIEAVAR